MALTFRTTKGSALTIEELDANFEYFTGSHSITGSLVVSESIQASSYTGSAKINEGNITGSFTGSFIGETVVPVLNSIPTGSSLEGTIKLFTSESLFYIYAFVSGSWKSGSLL